MFLFYDFETSSRELLGQIISYAFVLTDSHLEPLDTLTGTIKLNKTQCPEVGAILTNKININDLQKKGQPEYEAAEQVFNFISTIIASYGQITLVGFNSNNFDLGFLRNLLVRYGFNPYFSGKLKNLDILHWIQLNKRSGCMINLNIEFHYYDENFMPGPVKYVFQYYICFHKLNFLPLRFCL